MHPQQSTKRKQPSDDFLASTPPCKLAKPNYLPELIHPPTTTLPASVPREPGLSRPHTMADDKERAEALKAEGNAFLKTKDFAKAEECYTKAIELHPTVEAYYTNRCLVRTNQRKFDEAIDDCRAALKLNPKSAKAYGRMGSTQYQAGRFALSVEAYEAALEIEPGNSTYQAGVEAAQSAVKGPAAAASSGGQDGVVSQLQSILTAAAAGPTAAKVASVHENSADMTIGMARSARAMNLFNEVKADYEAELAKVTTEDERNLVLEQLHKRSAPKVLALARNNGGIYNKAAQFVASLQGGAGDKGVPKAYVKALAVLTDGAPFRSFAEMEPVLVEEFGKKGRDLFRSIQSKPIAAASLAQVHRAETKDGEAVAVKILYPALRKEMASDFAVFRMVGAQIKPGGFDLQWLVKDFEEALSMELDLETEAHNARKTARLLHARRNVRVPRVLDALTCKSVLTMEFVEDMVKLTDAEALERNHLDARQCAQLLADVMHEMALVHGHVHGDPHAGNVYVRVQTCSLDGCTPELVLLDHGLYHTVPDAMRRDLCKLLLASVSPWATRRRREALARRFAGPLFKYFPPILSPWFVFSSRLTASDLAAAAKQQLPQDVTIKDVGECLVALHDSRGDGGNMLVSVSARNACSSVHVHSIHVLCACVYAVLGVPCTCPVVIM
jgi:aarF domain-containing kinase